jgi:predicted lipid-binding transport protein (Tim44 family)
MKELINTLRSEENRPGSISVLLIVTAILGGIAAGLFLGSPLILGIIALGTMLTEVLILAVQPMKRIFLISAVASVVNLGFIVAGILS